MPRTSWVRRRLRPYILQYEISPPMAEDGQTRRVEGELRDVLRTIVADATA